MPIKPENKALYPPDWPEVRARILARADNRCEQCKLPNGAFVIRGADKDEGTYQLFDGDGEVYDEDTGMYLGRCKASEYNVKRSITVVLTIAHLDHNPSNCVDDNLRAWCQLHHLRYDAQHHAETARATRRARKAIGDLFAEAP
jgi:hypothetical protein